ncbi:hypothetical protein D5282_09140 [bacterium 1xD8-48]|nr:hypothetical protein [bacterium 1xD8-48]
MDNIRTMHTYNIEETQISRRSAGKKKEERFCKAFLCKFVSALHPQTLEARLALRNKAAQKWGKICMIL